MEITHISTDGDVEPNLTEAIEYLLHPTSFAQFASHSLTLSELRQHSWSTLSDTQQPPLLFVVVKSTPIFKILIAFSSNLIE